MSIKRFETDTPIVMEFAVPPGGGQTPRQFTACRSSGCYVDMKIAIGEQNKMNIIIIIVLICFTLPNMVFSQDFEILGEMYTGQMKFFDNEIEYWQFNEGEPTEERAEFEIDDSGSLRRLTLLSPINKSYVFLRSEPFSVLLNTTNQAELFGLNRYHHELPTSIFGIFEGFFLSRSYREVSASSFLIEGQTEYSPENLKQLNGAQPWVEGVPGQGIGETISVSGFNAGRTPHTIIISIGFVDFNRPYLYEYNSRPSTIRIWLNDSNDFMDVELNDSPDPQIINLSQEVDSFKIEILQVYPGTKWEDTCINFIMVASDMQDYFN
jgi:hypothetical protein